MEREQLQRGLRRMLGVIYMFIIFIVVMVSWVYTYAKTYQILPIKYEWHLYLYDN